MWPHKDDGWWALVISIIALVLVYPLEVLAHNTAPWWKNWWAERSTSSTRKRIDRLEKQLAVNEQRYEVLSAGEDQLLKGIAGLGLLGSYCIELLSIVLLVIAWFLLPPHDKALIIAVSLFATAFGYIMGYAIYVKISVFRGPRSPTLRSKVRKNIEKLKKSLAEKART